MVCFGHLSLLEKQSSGAPAIPSLFAKYANENVKKIPFLTLVTLRPNDTNEAMITSLASLFCKFIIKSVKLIYGHIPYSMVNLNIFYTEIGKRYVRQ